MPDRSVHGTRPTLGVVVCTYNRASLLKGALEALTCQTAPRDVFEVVVIDDGSTDDTRLVVESFASRIPVSWVYQRNAGLASARNHGLFRTAAPLVLFLDDDDEADPGLLDAHLEAHDQHAGRHEAILGLTHLAPAVAIDPLMHFVTEVGCFLFSYPQIAPGQPLDYTYFWGGRTSCKRSFLLEHGIFNRVFRFGCEDIELGFRLSRHGLRVFYQPKAVSTMMRGSSLDEFCNRLVKQGRSNVVFSRLHEAEEVRAWTEVDGALEAWTDVEQTYGRVLESTRRLDRMVRRKAEIGLRVDDDDRRFLYHAYWTACRASKLKGIAEGLRESVAP